jgi:hypothetical protein
VNVLDLLVLLTPGTIGRPVRPLIEQGQEALFDRQNRTAA